MKFKNTIICLMGPTASGKTALAVELVQRLPCDIISVDSAMVYRGMDIGSAKPDATTLKKAPHRLIDIVDPAVPYSAGQFRIDALREIHDIIAHNRIPLLVGGTMMYFKVLQQGLATLPQANAEVRAEIKARAERDGWEKLHAELTQIDPIAAARININDAQRIQRAIEVFRLTGKSISSWQAKDTNPLSEYTVINIGLMPSNRELLHQRIAQRFDEMLAQGLLDEVKQLYARGDLTADLPSIRSVGYRQVWNYLAGNITKEQMREQAITATRQLAKRQMTWLRSWLDIILLDSEANDLTDIVMAVISTP